jgi:hypothetical protein
MKKIATFLSYFKEPIARNTLAPSFLLVLLSFGAIFWFLFPEASEQIAVPLHYNIHFGVDRYGAWWQIFTIPTVGLGIVLLNGVTAAILWSRDKMLSVFLSLVTLGFEVLLCVALTFVILLNLSYYG